MGAPNGGMEEKKKMVEDYVHGSSLYHFSCGAIPRMEGLVVHYSRLVLDPNVFKFYIHTKY